MGLKTLDWNVPYFILVECHDVRKSSWCRTLPASSLPRLQLVHRSPARKKGFQKQRFDAVTDFANVYKIFVGQENITLPIQIGYNWRNFRLITIVGIVVIAPVPPIKLGLSQWGGRWGTQISSLSLSLFLASVISSPPKQVASVHLILWIFEKISLQCL